MHECYPFPENLKPLIVVNYSSDPVNIGRQVSNGRIFLLVSSFVSLGDFRKTRNGTRIVTRQTYVVQSDEYFTRESFKCN